MEMAVSARAPRRPRKARTVDVTASHAGSDSVDYEALAQLRYELRKFQAFSSAAATKAGLTAQQHQALLIIRGFSDPVPVSIGDLAKYLLIRHHTAVELVDRMTRLELISREVDGADARRVLIKLTREGEKRLQKLSRIHLKELQAIGPTLTGMLKPFQRR
jgi:DNA-binding MarR family transcriptional regulator